MNQDSPPPEPTPPLQVAPTPAEVSMDTSRRGPMLPAVRDPSAEISMRNSSGPFQAPSPSPSQYQAHMAPAFQPVTPGMGAAPVHQSPVPIPQPIHHSPHPPQVPIRPMHYQQQAYSQSPAPPMHHQPLHNPLTPGYGQGPPLGSRSGLTSALPNGAPSGNMYNPPRPPEVYTLPDAVNDTVPEEVRRQFRCDSAGRVLFFTAPPLDRTGKPLSPGSAGLGHSAKYLSGRKEWLAERERKRKIRHEESSRDVRRKSPPREEFPGSEPDDSMVSRATEALATWFRNLDEDTAQWQKQAGLEGWKGVAEG